MRRAVRLNGMRISTIIQWVLGIFLFFVFLFIGGFFLMVRLTSPSEEEWLAANCPAIAKWDLSELDKPEPVASDHESGGKLIIDPMQEFVVQYSPETLRVMKEKCVEYLDGATR